ncbi:Mitotic spindle assembly checkpoint protein MAD2A [Cryptotermes secundus]|uniref:Mitotic spindle assembly checkpoint protein MAD2A n=1 Tax=Cryptotermes secundus TaxID=105785 RepID=A0A2J7RCH4_9NEOP|nr:mitotic spindle assembly checkpoint protein MAD2A [Cryptotermes secundus]PNF38536.1 Mitotic spindle assembly checkpoint protein MAD2A [Cryptotermes secundus]
MASTEQETKGSVTLKGSSDLVKEYLDYGINSILYQRGIYPAETFVPAEHFGITMYMSTDEKIKSFLKSVLEQIRDWLCQKKMQKVSLIISNSATKEVLERWDFKVQYEGDGNATESGKTVGNKDFTLIQKEIRSVLRQISGTVSFLPLLDCLCTFDLQVYTVTDCEVPQEWDETQPCFIANAQEMPLRTFSTSLHRVETHVSYKAE